MFYPLGRVTPAPVQRFHDKLTAEARIQTLDVSDWLAEEAGDTFYSATVTAVPSGEMTFGAATCIAGVVTWVASGGTEDTDYQIVITHTSVSGRIGQQVWRCLVPVALEDVTTSPITGQDLMTVDLNDLPTDPAGLPAGTLWNNGGLLAVVTS